MIGSSNPVWCRSWPDPNGRNQRHGPLAGGMVVTNLPTEGRSTLLLARRGGCRPASVEEANRGKVFSGDRFVTRAADVESAHEPSELLTSLYHDLKGVFDLRTIVGSNPW